MAVEGRTAGGEVGFAPLGSLVVGLFRIILIGDFLPFDCDCVLPGRESLVSMSTKAISIRHNSI